MSKTSIKRKPLVSTFVLAFAVIAAQFGQIQPAQAASSGGPSTCTSTTPITVPSTNVEIWTGTAGDLKFSTAGNWSNDTLPVTGDTIVFNSATTPSSITIVNDLPSVLFGGVIVDSTSLSTSSTISITNKLNLAADASIQRAGCNLWLSLNNGVDAAGALSVSGGVYLSTGVVAGGVTMAGGGITIGDGTNGLSGVTSLTLQGNSKVILTGDVAFPISVASGATAKMYIYSGYSPQGPVAKTITVSGAVSLNSNLTVLLSPKTTLNFTGSISGSEQILRDPESDASAILNVGGTAITNPVVVTQLDGEYITTELPNNDTTSASYEVYDNTTATLDGTRATIYTDNNGTLKGTGTTGSLYINRGGKLAPGHSPGKLTVLNLISMDGVYQAEILNKDSYDQLSVGQNYSGTSEAVTLGTAASLDVQLYEGWAINQGETFTIIDNKSSTQVSGTFQGFAEGAKIVVGSMAFTISYVGGDGNDVVLTALNSGVAPATPNTGALRFIMANPIIMIIAGIVAVAAVLYIAKRRNNNA